MIALTPVHTFHIKDTLVVFFRSKTLYGVFPYLLITRLFSTLAITLFSYCILSVYNKLLMYFSFFLENIFRFPSTCYLLNMQLTVCFTSSYFLCYVTINTADATAMMALYISYFGDQTLRLFGEHILPAKRPVYLCTIYCPVI